MADTGPEFRAVSNGPMPSVIIAGGGLAGLSAAAALGGAGYQVEVFESRPYLGGRATSYRIPSENEDGGEVDNCQHVLLRCCVNLLDFYHRLGVLGKLQFHREFYFIEPGGRVSTLKAGKLPAPLHFTESFLKLACLNWGEKIALGRALLALRGEFRTRQDLNSITMLDWLHEKSQPPRVIERFWRQVLVSAINEELDRMAAHHGFQVFWLGFLARPDGYEMGVPSVPLGDLYGKSAWESLPNVRFQLRAPVEGVSNAGAMVHGGVVKADAYVCTLPFERVGAVLKGFEAPAMEHSPITGIHLWFDRPVTDLPHATLLDRTVQWLFNKDGGRYIQVVVSASRNLIPMSKAEVVELAIRELAEFFPAVRDARLLRSHVVKEVRATFSAAPGVVRPGVSTHEPGVFVAGDWTDSGWPATMEGSVRSGYLAAEAVTRYLGSPQRFLLPDMA
ncbi:MAG TPA: hydroxysqualene dehydroxylase HpnE [Bryobacteraceae bacterium]|nr:hydroxysqualene dehydroxylase HpnE [Bryobacteraceae bacterium]